jgi:hypothetical protein
MLSALAVLLLAPAPFPKTRPAMPPLVAADMVGDWTMNWLGYPYAVTFARGGAYAARPATPSAYAGSWGVAPGNRLWITESASPNDPTGWVSYVIVVNPATMTGSLLPNNGKVTFARRKVGRLKMPKGEQNVR